MSPSSWSGARRDDHRLFHQNRPIRRDFKPRGHHGARLRRHQIGNIHAYSVRCAPASRTDVSLPDKAEGLELPRRTWPTGLPGRKVWKPGCRRHAASYGRLDLSLDRPLLGSNRITHGQPSSPGQDTQDGDEHSKHVRSFIVPKGSLTAQGRRDLREGGRRRAQ